MSNGAPYVAGSMCCDSNVVDEYANTTKINGAAPTALPSPATVCGEAAVCAGQYKWWDDFSGSCGPWVHNGQVPPNTFSRIGTKTIPRSVIGFKNVQAAKNWHGSLPFTHKWYGLGYGATWTDDMQLLCGQDAATWAYWGFTPYKPTPMTHYLDLDLVSKLEYFSGAPDCWAAHSGSTSMSSQVNRLTGVKTVNGSSTDPLPDGLLAVTDIPSLGTLAATPFRNQYSVGTCTSTGWSFHDSRYGSAASLVTCTFGPGTCTRSQYGQFHDICGGDGYKTVSGPVRTQSLQITDTTISYSDTTVTDGYSTTKLSIQITLSNQYDFVSALLDAYALLGTWNLADNNQYPWRTDGNVGTAPLVTRRESPATVPSASDGFPFTDSNAGIMDGSIIGAPNPAGHDATFDFRHENWTECPGTDMPDYYDVDTHGAATPYYLPQNATQWTVDVAPLPPGAGIFYNITPVLNFAAGGGQTVMVQKWAEQLMPWPSVNFARPGGADKFVYNETKSNNASLVYQVESISGDGPGAVVALTDANSQPISNLSVKPGDVWGGPSVDGFYNIAAVNGSTMMLGAKVYPVPSGWKSPSDDTDTCFGRLRWPGCPAILGRASITSVANASPTSLATELLPFLGLNLLVADRVDVCDAQMNVLASNVDVTRTDDSNFTVTTDYTIIRDAAWLVIHGAPAHTWNDTSRKGTALVQEFLFDNRTPNEVGRVNGVIADCWKINNPGGCDCGAEGSAPTLPPYGNYYIGSYTQTQYTLPINPCAIAVICISPNGETFPNGVTYPMPSNLVGDDDYGTRWQAAVVQAVTDPFAQTPHNPPSFIDPLTELELDAFQWLQDDGTCQNNSTGLDGSAAAAYYAHLPVVEAVANLPVGAPALPPDVILGFISPIRNPGGSDVAAAPGMGSTGGWTFYQNACSCITAAGRFAGDYAKFMLCSAASQVDSDCGCTAPYPAPAPAGPVTPQSGAGGNASGGAPAGAGDDGCGL